ncbi:putative MO25-like protein [Vitis vinifera]|uniref:Putative MO25-like protein n=1 Tax=Vitis vinifera TaxID=29760 RepID=A0A438FCU5_VITVI|nr:putative MO25-like protein [Vitis vinifera]
MKALFKTKPRTPAYLVRQTRDLLIYLSGCSDRDTKRELKLILYGSGENEPVAEACAELTQEFFKENTLRLLIIFLRKLNLEARRDATQVVANLQRQQVKSRLIASDYLEANLDLMELLISGYEDLDIALHYGGMLKECIRHQSIARHVLESQQMRKFFDYIQIPNFDVAADATATFKGGRIFREIENNFDLSLQLQDAGISFLLSTILLYPGNWQELLTRHKSTVAEFLKWNYDWLLAEILLDRSNCAVMVRYVSSKDNMRILMNLLREPSKTFQIEAFHVFKLFVANKNKPDDIINILVANRTKLLFFFSNFKIDGENEGFEEDKAHVVKEIAELQPK